jgi:cyclohexadieny/prephenate dehydrogenase
MFERVALIGLGLIGSSLAHAIKRGRLAETIAGYDASETVRKRAAQLELAAIAPSPALVVKDADLVILCSPIGSYKELAAEFAPHLRPGAILTDVGSVKSAVLKDVTPFVPKDVHFLPAHPIAGTEQSGPDAGFPSLFDRRWCIITPPPGADGAALTRLKQFWEKCGSQVDVMDAGHHDLVLAMTSHVPHLIAYNIVGTAHDLEKVAETEVIKFSAGGFRDFTRIAASDPTMWRDVFLNNRDAVLEVLGRFNEDLSLLQRAIRDGNGQFLFDMFSRTRAIRRSIIDIGQDSAAPNFGRDRSDGQKK